MTTTPSEEPEKQSDKPKPFIVGSPYSHGYPIARDTHTNKQEDQSDVELPDDLEHALNSMLFIVRSDEFHYDGNADKQARQKERTRQAVKTFKQYLNARQDRAVAEADRIYRAVRNNSRVVLYTDPIGRPDEDGWRDQASRDDLWAISTEELNILCGKLTNNKKPNEEEVK